MPKINLMPKEIAELIAAGEVVERPASVVKELLENSIDAGAKHITLEINRGGILYIRVTDDGCGIESADVKTAFLRHATSKIKSEADLYKIMSLGFRGEALAATACVSKVELFTKREEDELGTHYVIEGAEEKLFEESGCPKGTTVIVRDIFYNTPARMKFLKKDVTEGNSAAAIFERVALSHPDIAFKLIRDGKTVITTSGDNNLSSAIYSVLGREIALSMIPVNSIGDLKVDGFVCKPVYCRKSRAVQYTFINGRYVQSNTVMAACEQAYKNSAMIGKYPAFLLNITVDADFVDVNVHPAKTQVRFSDEKRVFDAVYYAVKDALFKGDTRPEIVPSAVNNAPLKMSVEQYRQEAVKIPVKREEKFVFNNDTTPFFDREDVKKQAGLHNTETKPSFSEKTEEKAYENRSAEKAAVKSENEETAHGEIKEALVSDEEIIYIGEAFKTYIVAQKGDSIYLIDKHAAHERINFNYLKTTQKAETQQLLLPVTVRLSGAEADAVINNSDLLLSAGFETEDFGNGNIIVRAVPAMLSGEDVTDLITEAAQTLLTKGIVESERKDRILHTVACKAAIKGGNETGEKELTALAKTVLLSDDIMYCPHGRPVAFRIKKKELEKQFGRIQ